jgi:DNA-binding NarL/FixJ family response regulator
VLRTDVLVSSPVFLIGLVEVLEKAGITVVSVRRSARDAPSWLADAALIDADALEPAGNLHPITEAARSTAVLVLQNEANPPIEQYLRAGATGVISKRESGERIVTAIQAVTVEGHLTPCAMDPTAVVEPPDTSACHLSEREEQVLGQIAHGLTHGQIATRLAISPHTVDTYVKRIRAKLGVGNKAELTRAALLGRFTTGTTTEPSADASGSNPPIIGQLPPKVA